MKNAGLIVPKVTVLVDTAVICHSVLLKNTKHLLLPSWYILGIITIQTYIQAFYVSIRHWRNFISVLDTFLYYKTTDLKILNPLTPGQKTLSKVSLSGWIYLPVTVQTIHLMIIHIIINIIIHLKYVDVCTDILKQKTALVQLLHKWVNML